MTEQEIIQYLNVHEKITNHVRTVAENVAKMRHCLDSDMVYSNFEIANNDICVRFVGGAENEYCDYVYFPKEYLWSDYAAKEEELKQQKMKEAKDKARMEKLAKFTSCKKEIEYLTKRMIELTAELKEEGAI